MNISIKLLLVTLGVLVIVQVHAYTFRFHNNLSENVQVKMRLLGVMEPEETLDLSANETGEKSFSGLRIGLAPEYIRLVRTNKSTDRIDPQRICMRRATFDEVSKRLGNAWPSDEVMKSDRCPVLGDMEFEIVQDSRTGELLLVQIDNKSPELWEGLRR